MPNWCDNYIKIKGIREEIIRCIEGMKGKRAVYKEENKIKEKLEETYTFNATVKVPEEVLERGYEKAGYYWQKRNWGCKWDMLYESKYELDGILEKLICANKEENEINKDGIEEVEFFVISPWNSVDEWVKALSKKHSKLDFELTFEITEESFEDSMCFKNGIEIDKY
ncbi:hypothetical protein FHH43_07615 [Clostridium perfringens]|nr:hypothetical protein [Clostridium perfringens]